LALGGLVGLTRPVLPRRTRWVRRVMAGAGVAWGVYSLRGTGHRNPLGATADNFLRSVPMAVALSGVWLWVQGAPHATGQGIALAVASGALASGVGYSLWYAALPHLTATRAAIIQLSVPVLAAVGGVMLLGETLTQRLVLAGAALLMGVLLALSAKAAPRAPVAAPARE
ncbi:EamA family transporter, partial [Pyxidicoccus sp. 3LFB2]